MISSSAVKSGDKHVCSLNWLSLCASAALELDVLQVADLGDRRRCLVVQRPAVGHLSPHAVLVGSAEVAHTVAGSTDHQGSVRPEDRDDAQVGSLGQAVTGGDLPLVVVEHIADQLLVGAVQVIRLERAVLAIDQLHGAGERDLERGLLNNRRSAVLTRQDLVVALGAGGRVGVEHVVVSDGDLFTCGDLRAELGSREVGGCRDLPLTDSEHDMSRHGRLQRSNQFRGTFRSGLTSSLRLRSIWFTDRSEFSSQKADLN